MWFNRLQELFDGKNSGSIMAIKGICGCPDDGMLLYENPEGWIVESLENLADNIDSCDNDDQFIPPCIEPGVYGVHFIDSIFGAHVYFDNTVKQWYNEPLGADIGCLEPPDIDKCEAWSIAKRTVNEFIRQDVKLPLFGLPTIASSLVVAINLYGEDVLAGLMLEPNKILHDFSVINTLLIEIHQWYQSVLPMRQLQPVIAQDRTQPPGHGQLCGCSTQLISADLYEAQIAAFDNALLGAYPNGGMMHLCGSHAHLIPVFRLMRNLKSIQINDRAAHDLELYFNGLRDDQIIYLNPCEGMPVDNALKITGGERFVLIDNFNWN
jgi:hypothetical protein